MKTLKDEGVPIGARMVFRAKYAVFAAMLLCLLVTLPVAALWALLHESGQQFIDSLNELLEEKLVIIGKHRQQLIDFYRNSVDQ